MVSEIPQDMEEIGCPHLLKSICTSSVRKKMRTITKAKDKDKQNFCNPCEFRAFKDSNEVSQLVYEKLQCFSYGH